MKYKVHRFDIKSWSEHAELIYKRAISFILLSALLLSATKISATEEESPFPDPKDLVGRGAGEIILKKGTWGGAETDFGFVLVPENRSDPDSRLIRLPFIRQNAVEGVSSEPIFVMGGGPGASNLWGDLPKVFFAKNDLVRVGYRGVDGEVKLVSPEIGQAFAGESPLSPEGIARSRAVLRRCFDQLVEEGIDVSGYNMIEVVEDIEAVRRALGFGAVNLFSTSYGTQLAYLYCRKYPETAHRSLMVGASNRARRFVWDPEMVDRQLRDYAELWGRTPDAVERAEDLIGAIDRVLSALPRQWRDVTIDRDKIRLATFYLLYETESAAAIFDAYAAADKGDLSGLAVVCYGYDQDVQSPSRRYWGDFFSKIVSGGFGAGCGGENRPDAKGFVLGSPSAELWEAACGGGWPAAPIPDEFCRLEPIDVPTLVLNGNRDFSSPPQYVLELKPYLRSGTIVLLEEMGHMDVIRLQRDAFEHAVSRFFVDGVVDTSKYVYHPVDFTPEETYRDYARELFGGE